MSKVPDFTTRIALHKRSKGRCEICFVGTATDLHHRKRRREGDHSLPNCLHLCRNCHGRVHGNPNNSREHGWILPFCEEDPRTVPVFYRGFWVLFTDSGSQEHPPTGTSGPQRPDPSGESS